MAEGAPAFRPDVLILGDSHAVALQAGCAAHGIVPAVLSFSGNLWHQGQIGLSPRTGIRARGRVWQGRVTDLGRALGRDNVLSPELPVLACFGFHLGRIVPAFGYNGHQADRDMFLADPEAQFASSGLVQAYAASMRRGHLRMLAQLARRVPTLAVVPPAIYPPGNYPAFVETLKEGIRALGVPLIDPSAELFPGAAGLPGAFRSDDGVHGNADYGAAAIGMMIARGLIVRPGRA